MSKPSMPPGTTSGKLDLARLIEEELRGGLHYLSARSVARITQIGANQWWVEEAKTGRGLKLFANLGKAEKYVDRARDKAIAKVFP